MDDLFFVLLIVAILLLSIIGMEFFASSQLHDEAVRLLKQSLESSVKNTYITPENEKIFDRGLANLVYQKALKENFKGRIEIKRIKELVFFDTSNSPIPVEHDGFRFESLFGHAVVTVQYRTFLNDYEYDIHIDVAIQELD